MLFRSTFRDDEDPKASVLAYIDRIRAAHGDTVELDLGEQLPVLGLFAGLTA